MKFQPGLSVVWMRKSRGGYRYITPVNGVVVKVTSKRVHIQVSKLDGGKVIRKVKPLSLHLREQGNRALETPRHIDPRLINCLPARGIVLAGSVNVAGFSLSSSNDAYPKDTEVMVYVGQQFYCTSLADIEVTRVQAKEQKPAHGPDQEQITKSRRRSCCDLQRIIYQFSR